MGMKYFPLEVIDGLNEKSALDNLLVVFSEAVSRDLNKKVEFTDEFAEFTLTENFLRADYKGKWEDANNYILNNRELHNLILKGIKFSDWHQRRTEWRDFFGEYLILNRWQKSKVVYKVDNDFFHEIKNTGNLKLSRPMFKYLPVSTMYFDLYDVKGSARSQKVSTARQLAMYLCRELTNQSFEAIQNSDIEQDKALFQKREYKQIFLEAVYFSLLKLHSG